MPSVLGQIRPWNSYPYVAPIGLAAPVLTTVAQQVLGADINRAGVLFHNPGTQTKRVLPAGTTAAQLAAAIALLVGGTGGIPIFPQEEYILLQDETDQYNVNCAWIGVTDNNSDGALTIFNFTPTGQPIVAPTVRYQQQIPVPSPLAFPTNALAQASTAVLAANPNRTGVEFINPSTVQIAVTSSPLGASIGAGSIIILPGASKRIMGNDRVKITAGWNAIAGGAEGAITALSFHG